MRVIQAAAISARHDLNPQISKCEDVGAFGYQNAKMSAHLAVLVRLPFVNGATVKVLILTGCL
jgi:hypothetical protein